MEYFIGSIIQLPFNRSIRGWLPCHGQLLHVKYYQALFTLIGNKYGGQTEVTFQIPDLRVKRRVYEGY